ncbi:hypothetical protein EDB89DRAFT_2129343 [Lactarius sanguifluus]|nr:hypothetical protein EDB89DRAFT_2129343 [Lactarius sanguifluus]
MTLTRSQQWNAQHTGNGLTTTTLMFAALEATEDWFDRVRHTLARYFGAPDEDTAMGTCTVTYLAWLEGLEGEWLHAADHAALLDTLADEKASWMECMRTVAQSTIVLSVFGDHVADVVHEVGATSDIS